MSKLRIMIVDDDSIVRVGIKSAIDWEENGFELVGEAANGQEALDRIGQVKPDIVLTDILMPQMNGIELIEAAKETYSEVFFLILSCYGEFQYVQKALRLGALDYLLKSTAVDGEEFLKALQEAREKVLDARKAAEKPSAPYRLLPNHRAKHKFMKELVKNQIKSQDEIKAGLEELGLNYCSEDYFMIGIQVNGYYSLRKKLSIYELRKKIEEKVIAVIEEAIEAYGSNCVFSAEENMYIILLDIKNTSEIVTSENKIISIMELIRTKLKSVLAIDVNIYISRQIDVSQFFRSYESIAEASKNSIFLEASQTIMVKETSQGRKDSGRLEDYDSKIMMLWDQEERFLEAIRTLFMDVIAESKNIRLYEAVCIDVFSVHNKIVNNCLLHTNAKEDLDNLAYIPFTHMYVFDTTKETYDWIKEKFENLYRIVGKYETSTYNSTVNKVIEYINTHYTQSINLDSLSKELNFNKYYLCRVFKDETGRNITDYINNQRILKAKELLEDDTLKIVDISQLIGFNDVTYFNRVFKKSVGMSPGTYKNQLLQEV